MANEVRTSPFVSEQITSRPKRIIVCCDGTWQSSISLDPKRGTESNVARIARVLAKAGTDEEGRVWEQVVYYDAGIGTGNLGLIEKYTQGGLGVGLNENVVEAYNFIVNNYKQGDQLYFFGFSRGAYTVRAAAGLVGQIGIIQPAYMKVFVSSYAQYRNTKSGRPGFDRYQPWMDFADSHPQYLVEDRRNVVVQVIGVWDTVGALGIPELGHFWTIRKADTKYYEFYDTNLSPCIKHAFQALALDERRPAFDPTIWRLKNNNTTQLAQCWFPGAHINIGGGNNEPTKGKDDREQLASISYAWMLDRVRPYLAFDAISLEAQFGPLDKLSDTPIPPPQKE